MKRVLVLGAGLVARPLVRRLLEGGRHVVLADLVVEKAQQMLAGHPSGEARSLDLGDEAGLDALIRDCDLAVSLVPYAFHPVVARHCIAHRKHMVTASYVAPAMQALDAEARAAGVVLVNEVGLDPGIDHMSAMRIIDAVHKQGGRVTAFRSYCGGLPAPEANDNPFGYKFSWAPRGVLLAGRNEARYLLDGREVLTPNPRLFRDVQMVHVEGLGDFEAYPNRDSIQYRDIYGLAGIETLVRGTLRNPGWCDTLQRINELGLLSLDEVDVAGKTYAGFMRQLVGAAAGEALDAAVGRKLGIWGGSAAIQNLAWLGLFSDRPFKVARIAPLDALGELMLDKLSLAPRERDLVVLVHDFRAVFPDGHRERITSELVAFGEPDGDSAMARTVTLPAALVVDLVLDGKLTKPGVHRPVIPEIYEPVLGGLAQLGITCKEATEKY